MSRTLAGVPRSRPGSLADLEALGDNVRAELIGGVLHELPMTSFGHGHVAGCILAALWPVYQVGSRKGPGGWWLQPENDFVARGREVFRPDLLGWRKARFPQPPPQQRARVVPDWVCEILSLGTRRHDLLTKRDAYARTGVRHRWYVDPDVRVLQTFELRRGKWIETGAFVEDVVVRPRPSRPSRCAWPTGGRRHPGRRGHARHVRGSVPDDRCATANPRRVRAHRPRGGRVAPLAWR